MTAVKVRYIVDDVEAAIDFYTTYLDFEVQMHPAPGFAALTNGNLHLLLNQPGAGGAGQAGSNDSGPKPGGWSRFQLEVADLPTRVEALRAAGASFRGELVTGQGGKQILLEDPAGNPIELFEPHQ